MPATTDVMITCRLGDYRVQSMVPLWIPIIAGTQKNML